LIGISVGIRVLVSVEEGEETSGATIWCLRKNIKEEETECLEKEKKKK
jgi:hypothetical protein